MGIHNPFLPIQIVEGQITLGFKAVLYMSLDVLSLSEIKNIS